MNDPKTTSAFPVPHMIDGNWAKQPDPLLVGLSQYAYVAALFHAAIISANHFRSVPGPEVKAVFDHADAFFAELAKRTS